MKKILVGMLIFGMLISGANAVQYLGGKGLFYTQSAMVNDPGQLSIALFSRGYAKNVSGEDVIRHGAAAVSVNFGFTRHFEFNLSQIVAQSVHLGSDPGSTGATMMPGNTLINLKFGNYQYRDRPVYYGFNFLTNFRTGDQYDIYLEPYQDFAISGQLNLFVSYYWKPLYIEESPALHFNLGYANFNDRETIFSSAQSLPISIAYCRGSLKREYSCELHGEFFTNRPPVATYSRENYMYLCPAFKYKVFMGLYFSAGLDILLFTEKEKSSFEMPSGYPQYPEWRLNFKVAITPSTAFYQIPTFEKPSRTATGVPTLGVSRVITDKKSLFEWVVDENQGAQYIDLELEKIREERKRAEAELEKLKSELEAAGKK